MAAQNPSQKLTSEQIARAWRDEDFFAQLTEDAKLSLPAHPAGDIAWQASEPFTEIETLAPVPGNPCGGSIAPCSIAPCSFAPCTFAPCH